MGSRRTSPVFPSAAAVVSDPMVAPMNTPWIQLKAWQMSGTLVARRPPKMIAESGTPAGSSQAGSMLGQLAAGAVKREFGCAAGVLLSDVQAFPRQSVTPEAGIGPKPSHQTSPSPVKATLVKMVSLAMLCMAVGLDSQLVPGATPKKPASGLMAR